MTPDQEKAAAALRCALDMHEAGVALMRQNLRRRHPEARDSEVDELLAEWLATRPGAEYGDSSGTGRRWTP